MQNDVLKNKIAPWQEKGRWYHAFIESTGTALKLTICDLEGVRISGTSLLMPNSDFKLIDVKVVDEDLASGKSLADYTVAKTSGTVAYTKLPSAGDFTYIDLWFFGYFKD